jgi:guanylate kinase
MRLGESEGVDYYFVSLDQLVDNGAYILKRVRSGDVYAVREDDLKEGSHILLTTFPPRGVMMLRQLGHRVICFHLELSEDERIGRMRGRGDRLDNITERLRIDAKESSLSSVRSTLGDSEFFVLNAQKSTIELAYEVNKIVSEFSFEGHQEY